MSVSFGNSVIVLASNRDWELSESVFQRMVWVAQGFREILEVYLEDIFPGVLEEASLGIWALVVSRRHSGGDF